MNNAPTQLLNRCVTDAFAGSMTFLETVQHMSSIGVRWYSANLHFGMKTHYFEGGQTHQVKWPEWTPISQYLAFNETAVVAAIRAIQRGEIIYPEFLRQIRDAGTVVYTVHLKGRKAIYFGADGDFHVEHFPNPV